MRIFLITLPLIALVSACSESDSLENTGREAGAAADRALERVGNEVMEERADFQNSASAARENARGVKEDVKAGLKKADNAVDAAAEELKK